MSGLLATCSTGRREAVHRWKGRAMVSSADVTERLMARFEGLVPLSTVGEVVRRVLREHDGLVPPSMAAVEREAAVRLERLAARDKTGPMP